MAKGDAPASTTLRVPPHSHPADPEAASDFSADENMTPMDPSNHAQAKTPRSGGLSYADRRATHNATERLRRESLNQKFHELAACIPSLGSTRKPSKSQIVCQSLDYVRYIQQRSAHWEQVIRDLYAENELLRQNVNQYRSTMALAPLPARAQSVEEMLSDDPTWLFPPPSMGSGGAAPTPDYSQNPAVLAAKQPQFMVNPLSTRPPTPPVSRINMPRRLSEASSTGGGGSSSQSGRPPIHPNLSPRFYQSTLSASPQPQQYGNLLSPPFTQAMASRSCPSSSSASAMNILGSSPVGSPFLSNPATLNQQQQQLPIGSYTSSVGSYHSPMDHQQLLRLSSGLEDIGLGAAEPSVFRQTGFNVQSDAEAAADAMLHAALQAGGVTPLTPQELIMITGVDGNSLSLNDMEGVAGSTSANGSGDIWMLDSTKEEELMNDLVQFEE